MIGLINDQEIAKNIEIGQIEILDTFSFFELDKNFTKETIDAFEANDVTFEGRGVNVEITEKKRSGRRRSRSSSGGGKSHRGRRSESGERRSKNKGHDLSSFGRKRSEKKSSLKTEKSTRRKKRKG